MRFLHKDIDALRQFLATEPCAIRRLEWDLHPMEPGSFAFLPWTVKRRPAQAPQSATLAEIEDCFRAADRAENAGTALRYYFHVNAPAGDRAVSLGAAVEHVEAFGGPAEFVLAGHPDGGIVSASRRVLPFQDGATRIDDWWGPR